MAFGNGVAKNYTKDDRFKLTWIGVYAGAPGVNQYVSSKFYYYKNNNLCASSTTAVVGNIVTIHDGLNFNGSQYFCYDNLNRLSLFENDDASMIQSYSYDSFGNVKGAGTLNSQFNYNGNNQISSSGYSYDAAGNLISINNGIFTSTYTFDADNRMFTNSVGGYYTYDANNERMRKDNGGTYTEYQYLNSQPIAERHADGTWSDYIYANGDMIARAESYNRYIQFTGRFSSVGNYGEFNLTPASSQLDGHYVIQSGDKLAWRQHQSQAYGGVYLFTTDGSNGAWTLKDQNGEYGNDSMQTDGAWHARVVDLSAFAGKTVSSVQLVAEGNSPAGNWTMQYADLSLLSTNGTVMPIYNGATAISGSPWGTSGYTFGGANVQTASSATGDTIYYHGDQIGSVRMLTSSDGWPISSDTFYPFGQELSPTTDPNHYRFADNERDAESGLDYMEARYYSSSTGRFINPDPSGLTYADITNPQSLNLYSYALNNPLIYIDPSGMACVWDNGSFDSEDDPSTGTPEKCAAAGGTWLDKGATASLSGGQDWSNRPDQFIADAANFISASVNANDKPWGYADMKNLWNLWNAGTLPQQINYGPWDQQTIAMSHDFAVNRARSAYIKAGCPGSAPFSAGHYEATADHLGGWAMGQPNYTAIEVGGYSGTIVSSGDTTTFTVKNTMSMSSLNAQSTFTGGHSSDNPHGPNGPQHNVKQTFQWTESNLCHQ